MLALVCGVQADASTFTPLNVSLGGYTLVEWLDGQDNSTISQSSNAVSQWNDKSGNGCNVTASSTAKPTLTASAIGSSQALAFNGSTNVLSAASCTLGGATTFDVFVVLLPVARTAVTEFFSGGVAGTYHAGLTTATSYLNPFEAPFGGTNLIANSALSTSTASIVDLLWSNATNFNIYINGLTSVNGNTSQSVSAMSSLFVGADSASLRFYQGDIGEIVVVGSVGGPFISATYRQKIEGYLAWKWGLLGNFSAGFPYLTSPPQNCSSFRSLLGAGGC